MLKLMLNAGLHASEVLSLTWRDVDLHTGRLVIRRGKGDKDRQVWVNDEVVAQMRAWREHSPASPYCFPTLKGTRIYDAARREMVKRRRRKAGISKDVHPHMLRHNPANLLMWGSLRKHRESLAFAQLHTALFETLGRGQKQCMSLIGERHSA